MKICRFIRDAETAPQYGIYADEQITPLSLGEVFGATESPAALIDSATREPLSLAKVMLLPPTNPSKIVCVGRNYAAHARELGNDVPTAPLLFLKAPTALITAGDAIRLPPQSQQVEHEGELAVIIKRTAKNIGAAENPLAYVLGYTPLNDVTARDLQRLDVQFTRAKSFDTFSPVGRFIETELNPAALALTVRVNQTIKQAGNTKDMIFPVAELIRYISAQMTLLPGDIIATGTPSGVSRLVAGDLCTIEIEGLETLTNPVA